MERKVPFLPFQVVFGFLSLKRQRVSRARPDQDRTGPGKTGTRQGRWAINGRRRRVGRQSREWKQTREQERRGEQEGTKNKRSYSTKARRYMLIKYEYTSSG